MRTPNPVLMLPLEETRPPLHSAEFIALVSLVLTLCSEHTARDRPPALSSVSSRRRRGATVSLPRCTRR